MIGDKKQGRPEQFFLSCFSMCAFVSVPVNIGFMETPKAYLGKDNYIFVSYSHRDTATVLPFIAELQKKYNVWFDEGIGFGKEWEDEIAERLLGCELFIFMVSENSLASSNCKDEIHLAREKGKKFINAMIQKVTPPDSFMLRYARYQTCSLYNYPNLELAVMDMEKKCEKFKDCAKASEPKPEEPVTESKPKAAAPALASKVATPPVESSSKDKTAEAGAAPKKKNFFKDVMLADKLAFALLIASTLQALLNIPNMALGTSSRFNYAANGFLGLLFGLIGGGLDMIIILKRPKNKKGLMALRIAVIACILISFIFFIVCAAN